MVIGLEAFREAFEGYEDCYTIIGGTACDILMNRAVILMKLINHFSLMACHFHDLLKKSFILPES